jgi:uracil-DNA glycosylase
MAQEDHKSPTNAARAARQKLESLRDAGVSHIPKAKSIRGTFSAGRGAGSNVQPLAAAREPSGPPVPPGEGGASPPGKTVSAPSPAPAASPASREEALAEVAKRVAVCTRCPVLVKNRTQTVFGVGNPNATLAFIGEAPGADEDRRGEPFVGRAGQLLTDIITKGMKLCREDVYIMNILRCRPPDNRTPLPDEAANCREYLDAQLAIILPQYICCLGACAAQNLLGVDTAIGKLRGRLIDFRGMKVLCTYHPAYVLRNPAAKKQVWEDIQILMKEMGLME